MAEYVFKPYPKCKYHPDGRVAVVGDPSQEQALGAGWQDKPFPPDQTPPETVYDPPAAPPVVASVPKRRGRPPKVTP